MDGTLQLERDELLRRAGRVRLLLLDVDGVLTDGGLYYFEDGRFAVRFHARDGHGLSMARRSGMLLGLVSGRLTPQARHRAEQLGFEEIHLNVPSGDKGRVVDEIMARRQLTAGQVCFVGDDTVDVAAMERVGLPVAVADAAAEVVAAAAYVTKRLGGHGAVREVVDLLLAAREKGTG
jgi:3-deoxy-D-manno-octulosonate 8-phosphate phosphatase (KDO 8-P phosphatase)